MSYSRLQKTRAQRLVSQLDNFATFQWRGQSSFDDYGAFIINSNDLKFYNGPQFSNEYSSPQYQTGTTNLLGISFKTQTIDFKVGIYWITAAQYQQFIEWINPYQIDYLTFSFNTKYSYLVKLSSIADSDRHIVGHENGEPVYYTEMTLKWDVQGYAGARATEQYETKKVVLTDINSTDRYDGLQFTTSDDYEETKIATPLTFSCNLGFSPNTSKIVYQPVTLKLFARYGIPTIDDKQAVYTIKETNLTDYYITENLIGNSVIELFSVTLKNITSLYNNNSYNIDITYDSEAGILYQTFADGTRRILNLLTATTSGENIVQGFLANKFKIPGTLSNSDFNMYNICFYWQVVKQDELTVTVNNPTISCYGRTNVI